MRQILHAWAALALCASCTTRFDAAGDTGTGGDADADEVAGDTAVDPDGDTTIHPDATDTLDAPADSIVDVPEEEAVVCESTIVDGAFHTTTAWTATGTARVDTTASGHSSPGIALFPATAACDLDTISQPLHVPDIGVCGPARLVSSVRDVTDGTMTSSPPAMSIGGGWTLFRDLLPTSWTPFSTCLGEAAYAAPSTLAFSAGFEVFDCGASPPGVADIGIDDVEIVFDPSCPHFGEVVNGDLEAGTGFGWGTSSNGGGVADTAAAGAGVAGSYGARIHIDAGCQEAEMWAPMSVPALSSMASPCLAYQLSLTPGETADFRVSGLPLLSLTSSTGYFRAVRLCLPHHVAGSVPDVWFHAAYWGFSCGTGAGPLDLVVDSFAVVDDPTCLFADGLLDPGFESSRSNAMKHGWAFNQYRGSWGGGAISEAVSDPSQARTGSGAGHLMVDQKCDAARLEQSIEVPAPSSSGGPAVVLWYRYPASSSTFLSFSVYPFDGAGEPLIQATPATATSWTRVLLCMPPLYEGRPATISIDLTSGGSCAEYITPESVWLDDFSVTTDSSCPRL